MTHKLFVATLLSAVVTVLWPGRGLADGLAIQGTGTWKDVGDAIRTETRLGDSSLYYVTRTQVFGMDGVIEGRGTRTVGGLIDRTPGIQPQTWCSFGMVLGVQALVGVSSNDVTLHTDAGPLTGKLVLGGTFVSVGDVNTLAGSTSEIELDIVGGTGELAGVRGKLRSVGTSYTLPDGTKKSSNRYCLIAQLCDSEPCPVKGTCKP